MPAKITSGRVGENKRAIDQRWDEMDWNNDKPRCTGCGEVLKRLEVGLCQGCVSGQTRPDA
jgi:hypothetical protein